MFAGIVFHNEQAFAAGSGIFLDSVQSGIETFGCSGLGDEGEGSARQAVLAIFVEGQHLDGDVAGGGILLQVVQHGPTQHVRQENVERDGGGTSIREPGKGLRRPRGHENLEAFAGRAKSHSMRA